MGNNSLGYMLTGGFILGYATRTLKLSQTSVLVWVIAAAGVWTVTTSLAPSVRIGSAG